MKYDVIVVGGGIAGLTCTAYLAKSGFKVLLCEKENKVGGLVNSFNYKGFTFDGGVRAIENSGMVHPMLKQLGIDVEFLKNDISIGIQKEVIKLTSKESIEEYKALLSNKFKNNIEDIENITNEIKKIIKYMDVLYGVDNPVFLDLKKDKEYLYKTILPWMLEFITTINKINKLNTPVHSYLEKFTENKALIDMIDQHFFKNTPTFFALSYFGLYLDYKYPKGGTSTLVEKIERFILDNNGYVKKDTEILKINTENKILKDSNGYEYKYDKLIWASDLNKLYSSIETDFIKSQKVKKNIEKMKSKIANKVGGESILSLYLTVDLDKRYFENICTEHFFYTANKKGLSSINIDEITMRNLTKEDMINWIREFYKLTTYEISIPVMRDESLAPKGKTGLIISTLMDYSIVKRIFELGWYHEFKNISEECILDVLSSSIFLDIKEKTIDKFTSTPLTLEKITGNSQGAITGWAFTNESIPVESKMTKIAKAINTPILDIYQAGQWTFSPAGLPISILTGKLAADKVQKNYSHRNRE